MGSSVEPLQSRPRTPFAGGSTPGPERRPFRDNPRLILAGILLLLASLAVIVWLSDRTTQLNPNFLSEAVLYTLSVADVTMLLALGFVLARNVIKLFVERRRGLPFARFRLKLVAALLGLTIVPSLLVLAAGTELIRQTTARWFSVPVTDVLTSANRIAGTFYRDRESVVAAQAAALVSSVPASLLLAGDVDALQRAVTAPVMDGRVGMIEIYRVQPTATRLDVVPIVALQSPSLPPGHLRASSDRLAAKIAAGSSDTQAHEPLEGGGELVRAGVVIRNGAGQPAGVVIASDFLSGDLARDARRIAEAYEDYSQLRVLKGPLEGVYLSLFVMMTLMILVSATWLGFYLAKRITRPVGMLAAGAREIGAGHLDHRIEPETHDEFGSLVEAFNAMAAELATSQRRLDRSRVEMERKNAELEERRRYIETVLQRIATGVISIGADGRVGTVNAAAVRLLAVEAGIVGAPIEQVLERDDLQPLAALVRAVRAAGGKPTGQEIALARDGREIHLAAAATALQGEAGTHEGTVLMFDDVTPLVRTQRVAAWRDVARRLAHEIKNPLTPIQLSAERMARHFAGAPEATRALVGECTTAIVAEVESLKALVDEFAQFARMPAPRAVPASLNALVIETLALYQGLLRDVVIERELAVALPPVRLDVEQMRRVIINLVDNAIEALTDTPNACIVVQTGHDAVNAVARVVIADNGPGVPAADREKLFMPYYSTKKRGSGLGLAIVRRIVGEHGGSIEVGDNTPTGSRFVIELPC
ncbi:MAG TPA: ATP-binding protein [Vicinamibacterales bacterium]|jgi:two-component system nitrogen regulation sensor histidine kinase NtrY